MDAFGWLKTPVLEDAGKETFSYTASPWLIACMLFIGSYARYSGELIFIELLSPLADVVCVFGCFTVSVALLIPQRRALLKWYEWAFVIITHLAPVALFWKIETTWLGIAASTGILAFVFGLYSTVACFHKGGDDYVLQWPYAVPPINAVTLCLLVLFVDASHVR
jgi:membrane-bound ClpP family serine protease